MKFRKIACLLAVAIIASSLVSCGAKGPEKTIQQFFAAVTSGKARQDDLKGVVEFEDSSLGTVFDNNASDNENGNKQLQEFLSKANSKVTYKIKDTKIDGDTATLALDVNCVDASSIMTEVIKESLSSILGSALSEDSSQADSEELMNQLLDEKIKNYDMKTEKKSIELTCKQKDGNWVIVGDMTVINVSSAYFMAGAASALGDFANLEQ